ASVVLFGGIKARSTEGSQWASFEVKDEFGTTVLSAATGQTAAQYWPYLQGLLEAPGLGGEYNFTEGKVYSATVNYSFRGIGAPRQLDPTDKFYGPSILTLSVARASAWQTHYAFGNKFAAVEFLRE
ncbi:MAG: hypothetical protein MUF48_25335, partial [Pirellulaceae bacterium]|nr:hypothetical protein [Pirellulaceae bacterium]